jgi:hypothetical protein
VCIFGVRDCESVVWRSGDELTRSSVRMLLRVCPMSHSNFLSYSGGILSILVVFVVPIATRMQQNDILRRVAGLIWLVSCWFCRSWYKKWCILML